jgi:hypothetical protein
VFLYGVLQLKGMAWEYFYVLDATGCWWMKQIQTTLGLGALRPFDSGRITVLVHNVYSAAHIWRVAMHS